MASMRFLLICLLALATAAPAHAQRFSPASLFYEPRTPSGLLRFDRVQIGTFMAQWDIPLANVASASSAIELETEPSALVTADYFLTRRLSVGGWWNPRSAELALTGAVPGGRLKLADVKTNFWDAHLTYALPDSSPLTRGVSFQFGYSGLHYDINLTSAVQGGRNSAFSLHSPNLWVNKSQRVWQPMVRGERRPVTLFGSVGYYTSADFDHDWNVILGGSFYLTRHLSLTSSVWFNGLDERTNTRVTAGLAGSF